MFKQFVYGLSNPAESSVVYVGRSKDALERRRHHVQMGGADFSPKGIWVHYLKHAGRWPDVRILEEREFSGERDAEEWAMAAEARWISQLSAEGHYLLNNECWWKHPERTHIPKGTREAWQRLHEIFFRLQFWLSTEEDGYIEITRFQAIQGLRALIKEYSALEVAPMDWIDPLCRNGE